MRKLALILVVISLLLTGCWGHQEVDRLAPVLAIGIDRIPGSQTLLLTVQIANPKSKASGNQTGGQGEGEAFTIMNSEGKSLFEAIRNLDTQSARNIFLAHNKVIVLGKDLAETGIGQILDDLKRDVEFRRVAWMLVTDKTAKEILEKNIALEQVPAKGLDQILQKSKDLGFFLPVDCNDFYARFNSDSHVSFAPLVQLEDINKRISRQLAKTTAIPQNSEEKPRIITIAKIAIFKNLRQVGVLNEEESCALRWFMDSPNGSSIVFKYNPPAQTNADRGEISLDIIKGETKITPQILEDGLAMNIKCAAKASLRDVGTVNANLFDPKVVEQLQNQAAEALKLQIEQCLCIAQKELMTDFVGFAEHLHDLYPLEWKQVKNNWEDIFPTVKCQISCEVEILKTGMISSPTLPNKAGGIN